MKEHLQENCLDSAHQSDLVTFNWRIRSGNAATLTHNSWHDMINDIDENDAANLQKQNKLTTISKITFIQLVCLL